MAGERVLGVDACRAGWVGIALTADAIQTYVSAGIVELVAAAEADGRLDVVGVDMSIGLADTGLREADVLARREIGARWASVFMLFKILATPDR